MDVSICIPTKNGGELFRQVLEAVFHQETRLEYEVICVDSGSTDGTLDVIRSFPAVRLYEIPPEEFGHGKTRRYAAGLGTGEYIVFLTQDAVPGSETWLEEMVNAIRGREDCALCFGIHYPYPDCNLLDKRDIRAHFRNFGTENTYFRIDDLSRYKTDAGYRQMLAFSSDNNACLRRDVMEKIPYLDAEFAEDQKWALQVLEAGYSKVYCPWAPVFHSHNYPMKEVFGRYYDEYKGLREVHGYRTATRKREIPGAIRRAVSADIRYIRQQPMTYKEKFFWCRYALKRNTKRQIAGYLGGIYMDKPEAWQRRADARYSQQLKQKKGRKGGEQALSYQYGENPVSKDYRSLWAYSEKRSRKTDIGKIFSFVTEEKTTEFRPADAKAAAKGPKIIHWIIPEPTAGSGGHTTIFRFVSRMAAEGCRVRVYIQQAVRFKTEKELDSFIREYFPMVPKEVSFHIDCEKMGFCHALIATGWTTAYFARQFCNTYAKFYFVQDYEPMFYPMGSEYLLAENTYRFGFRGITAGTWLKGKLESEFGMKCEAFSFSYDREIYRPQEKKTQGCRVFFYARPITPRRAWELGLLAMTELSRRMPEMEAVLAGYDVGDYEIPFRHINAGTVKPRQLAEYYGQSDICLVMSLTNLSLLPLEVMGSGGVIATQGGPNNEWMISNENAVLVGTDPTEISDTLEEYLKNPGKLAAIREAGRAFAEKTDWDTETAKICRYVLDGIREAEDQASSSLIS